MFRQLSEKAAAWWENISAREKRLVMVAGGAVGAIIFILIIVSLSSDLSERRGRILDKEKKIEEIIGLRNEFRQAENTHKTLEMRLKANSVNLLTFIEELARKMEVDVSDMNERTSSTEKDSKVKEISVEVTINKVTQERLIDFLDKLEHGPELIKITRLRMRARYDQQQKKLIDANVTISTYKAV